MYLLHDVLIIGDLEKAFLMVRLDKNSGNFNRFLWLRNLLLGFSKHNSQVCLQKSTIWTDHLTIPSSRYNTLSSYTNHTSKPQKTLRNIYLDNLFLEAENSDNAEKSIAREKGYSNEEV